jgi:uncharacterized membrane protein YkoI
MIPARMPSHESLRRLAPGAIGVVMLCIGALAMAPAWSDGKGKGDHERARQAVKAGEVMPLPALLERLQRTHPGQVLEIELEQEKGRWIYEVKLLQGGGGLSKLELDARTGEVLSSRSRSRDRPSSDKRR